MKRRPHDTSKLIHAAETFPVSSFANSKYQLDSVCLVENKHSGLLKLIVINGECSILFIDIGDAIIVEKQQ